MKKTYYWTFAGLVLLSGGTAGAGRQKMEEMSSSMKDELFPANIRHISTDLNIFWTNSSFL